MKKMPSVPLPVFGRATSMKTATLALIIGLAIVLAGCGGGTAGSAKTPSVATPVPTPAVASLSPSSGVVGSQALTLTVNGTGFEIDSVVDWNSSPRTTTFVNATQLRANILPADVASVGQASVSVVNPSGQSQLVSNVVPFPINNPQPVIIALAPSAVDAGAAPFTLAVTGSGFIQGATVQWNGGSRNTTFINNNQVQALILAADVANQGSAQITVANPPPSVGPSAAATFTINQLASNPAPTITSLSDTSAPAGWPGFPLTVDGGGFVSSSSGEWNGATRSTSTLSSSRLKTLLPLTDLATPGTALVSVFNPAPGGGISGSVSFTILAVAPGTPGVTERSSIATDLTEPDGSSSQPAISLDGRFVVFLSEADNLVPGDTNGGADVFLRDTCLGAASGCTPSVIRVSVATDGTQANGPSSDDAISANGRYVAFSTAATNLVPGGASGSNVFVRDTCFGAGGGCTPTTTRIPASNPANFHPSIGADGRYVAFTSGTFGACDYYGCAPDDFHALVADTCAGVVSGCTPATIEASLANDGSTENATSQDPRPVISSDGRFVSFQSAATNLVPGGTNAMSYVYLRDTCIGAGGACTPTTMLVSVASDGSQVDGAIADFSMSSNGRFITFSSIASGIVAADTNGTQDVFVRDTCLGVLVCTPSTTRVSLVNDGSEANGSSSQGQISATGEFVVFTSDSTNLVAGDTSPFPKIFLRDTCVGGQLGCTPSTVRLSVALDGTAADNQSDSPMLTGDARYVVFHSLASDLGPGDGNQLFDIFVARTNVP